MRKTFLAIALVLLLSFMVSGCNNDKQPITDDPTPVDPIVDKDEGKSNDDYNTTVFDVTQFANISSTELVSILGTPDNITETTERGFTPFPCTLYDYENHELGFLRFDIVNDQVTAISIQGELPYNNGNVLETLNVALTNDDHISSGDLYTKWEIPTEDIDLIHITLIDEEKDTYKSLSVEFDSCYYREWNLPIYAGAISPGEYRVLIEDFIKSMCTSPSSAKFPAFDWTYARNDFYFCAESYVDTKNAFGAEVRHYFSIVYYNDTQILAYAILDGEVIFDNEYMPTADVISSMFNGNTSSENQSGEDGKQQLNFALYTEEALPLSLTSNKENIIINQISYYWEENNDGKTGDLFLTFYTDKTFKNTFSIEYILTGEMTGAKYEQTYLVDDYGEDSEYGNCVFSIDIQEIAVDSYIISFGDINPDKDAPSTKEYHVTIDSKLPTELSVDGQNICVQNVEYQFDIVDDKFCSLFISFDLISDNIVKDFCLTFYLVEESTGKQHKFSIPEVNVYGEEGNYIMWASEYEDAHLPYDNYTLLLYGRECEHKYSEWIEETPATCDTDGTRGHYSCLVCNKNFDKNHKELTSLKINKGHQFSGNKCLICDYVYYSEGLEFGISDTREYCFVTGIGTCKDLEIFIPATFNGKPVTKIEDSAFEKTNITKVYIPDTITHIEESAFRNCQNLESVIMGKAVTHIKNGAFGNCSNLKEITLPNTLEILDGGAFRYCTSLEHISIPGNVSMKNGTEQFYGCTALKSVVILSGIEELTFKMFEGCTNLETISLPETIITLKSSCLEGCKSLTCITFNGTKEEWLQIEKEWQWDDNTGFYMISCIDGDF